MPATAHTLQNFFKETLLVGKNYHRVDYGGLSMTNRDDDCGLRRLRDWS